MPSAAADLTDDALTGRFRVYQRRRGHRYSLDDTVTAWRACLARPTARYVLDLGSGLGSVLLMLAYKLPAASLAAIEAQAESFALLRRNVERNAVAERARLHHGDLREPGLALTLARCVGAPGFDLITGTPPYVPPGHGPISPDSQRAHARVELRGGVEDYLLAAASALAPDGRVVVCSDARRPERVSDGARRAGLSVVETLDVVPSERKGALFSVSCLAPTAAADVAAAPRRLPAFVARDASGARTEASRALRRFFDLETAAGETASPPLRERSVVARGGGPGRSA